MRVVIIQTAFIGDVVLCSSLVGSLSGEGHTVGFVAKPDAASIFERDLRIEKVHVFDKRGKDKGVRGLRSISRRLRSEDYEAAVIPHRSLRSAFLARFARIPMRIGFVKSTGARLFTHAIEYRNGVHEIVRNHDLLAPLGITGTPPAPSLTVAEEDNIAAEHYFKSRGIIENSPVVGFGPGSKWFTKQWGEDRYKKLAELLTENSDCQIVCFGGSDEKILADKICASNSKKIHNAMGLLSLKESAAALQKVRVVVTNDNGLMHLAVAAGTPVIAIFGPTVPELGFAPWGARHMVIEKDLYCRPCSIHGTRTCPEKHFRCMNEIEPKDVLNAVKKYIDTS